jgi:hypothetical protein
MRKKRSKEVKNKLYKNQFILKRQRWKRLSSNWVQSLLLLNQQLHQLHLNQQLLQVFLRKWLHLHLLNHQQVVASLSYHHLQVVL